MTASPEKKPSDQNPADVDTTRAQPGESPKGPHERDETSGSTGGIRSETVEQGARDVERGVQDTSKATETDQAYQKQK